MDRRSFEAMSGAGGDEVLDRLDGPRVVSGDGDGRWKGSLIEKTIEWS